MTQRYLNEIKSELSQIGYAGIEHSAPNSELLAGYYKEIFNQTLCTTCRGELYKAYYEILNLTKLNSNIMAKGKYSIKNNGMIDIGYDPIPGVPQHVTNDNITDEIYHAMVKANPNFKQQFVEDPNYVAPEGEGKSKKAATSESEGSTDRHAEIMEMTKDEITKKLDKAKVEYPANAKKEELAQLLADSEGK